MAKDANKLKNMIAIFTFLYIVILLNNYLNIYFMNVFINAYFSLPSLINSCFFLSYLYPVMILKLHGTRY